MLYTEFLEGTGAVDTAATYEEYKRVEEIYMESSRMTKEDAYRMAKVLTVKEHEKQMRAERRKEQQWVLQNIIPAAAYIRGMSEKNGWTSSRYTFRSPCGNLFELKLVREINHGSVMLYEFWINEKQVELRKHCAYGLLPSAEFGTYRADWHDKSLKELEDLFGYIA